jgi:hypothetical protein
VAPPPPSTAVVGEVTAKVGIGVVGSVCASAGNRETDATTATAVHREDIRDFILSAPQNYESSSKAGIIISNFSENGYVACIFFEGRFFFLILVSLFSGLFELLPEYSLNSPMAGWAVTFVYVT